MVSLIFKIQDLVPGKVYKMHNSETNKYYRITTLGYLQVKNAAENWRSCIAPYNEILKADFEEVQLSIDWSKVPRGTKVQVRDSEEDEWRNRYFLEHCEQKQLAFKASTLPDDDPFVNIEMEDYSSLWNMCRLHESVIPANNWFKY